MIKTQKILISFLFIFFNTLTSVDAIQPSFISGSVRNSYNNTLIQSSKIYTTTGFSASAPKGLFHITVPPNIYSIIVSAPGFSSNIYSGIFATPGQTYNAEIWLTACSREISHVQGRVFELNTGFPVKNAIIISSQGNADITDSDGNFSLSLDSGITTLTASAKGFASRQAVDISLNPYSIKQVMFYLEKAPILTASVSGSIRNACTGEKIPNASVISPEREVVIANNGFFSIDTTPSGISTFIATAPGYQFSHKTAELIAFVSYTINFELVPAENGFGKVTGTVSNRLTGDGINDVLVKADKGSYTYTKSDGTYSLLTSTCSSFIEAEKQGFIKTRVPVSVAYSTSVSKDISINPLASVNGFIKDSDNQTLTGVDIYIEETTFTTTSKSRGFYRLDDIEPGSYNITANHPCFEKQTKEINLSIGQLLSEDFFLNPNPDGILYGTVTDSLTGMPVFNAELYTEYGRLFNTDDTGSYQTSLPSCTVSITADAEGYLSSTKEVEILKQTEQQLSFELTPCPLDFLLSNTGPGIFPYSEILRILRDRAVENDPELKHILQNIHKNAGELTFVLYKNRDLMEKASRILFESLFALITHNDNIFQQNTPFSFSERVLGFLDEFSRHTKNPEIHKNISLLKKYINHSLNNR